MIRRRRRPKPYRETECAALEREADALCRRIVMDRGICEVCGKRWPQTFETAHIFVRGHSAVRWDPQNLLCAHPACHSEAHRRPAAFRSWLQEKLSQEAYTALEQQANTIWRKSVPAMLEVVALLKGRLTADGNARYSVTHEDRQAEAVDSKQTQVAAGSQAPPA
jgi:hypothetical protein